MTQRDLCVWILSMLRIWLTIGLLCVVGLHVILRAALDAGYGYVLYMNVWDLAREIFWWVVLP